MPRALVRMIAIHLSRIWQDQKITPAFLRPGLSPLLCAGADYKESRRRYRCQNALLLAWLVLIDALGEIIAKRINKVINELSGQRG